MFRKQVTSIRKKSLKFTKMPKLKIKYEHDLKKHISRMRLNKFITKLNKTELKVHKCIVGLFIFVRNVHVFSSRNSYINFGLCVLALKRHAGRIKMT